MKTEAYTIGDTVKKTPACAKRYSGWKAEEGIIVAMDMKMVHDEDLPPSDRFKFRERYSYQSCYPVFDMVIEYLDLETNLKRQYRTTQFDFNKD